MRGEFDLYIFLKCLKSRPLPKEWAMSKEILDMIEEQKLAREIEGLLEITDNGLKKLSELEKKKRLLPLTKLEKEQVEKEFVKEISKYFKIKKSAWDSLSEEEKEKKTLIFLSDPYTDRNRYSFLINKEMREIMKKKGIIK